MVYPGSKKIHKLGGLQKFTAWNGPMMTDSGGYQIFSLGYGSVSQELKGMRKIEEPLVKVFEDGAHFQSYRDGKELFLSPEISMQAQIDFGSDLVFVLDECTAFNIKKFETEKSMYRSHRWAKRSLNYFQRHKKPHQGLYGIIQGGIYDDLRTESLKFINEMNFFGIGIGGSLGKDLKDMNNILAFIDKRIDKSKPVHLLGIGTIDSILIGIPYGIDTFDCVYPTRLARHGGALIKDNSKNNKKRYLNLKNQEFEMDERPIDENCNCCTCATFTRAYLHMMMKNDENIAIMALTQHNIAFMNRFMSLIREALDKDLWPEFLKEWQ